MATMEAELRAAYEPRPVRPLGVWTVNDWRVKATSISNVRDLASDELQEAARELAESVLPQPGVGPGRYGVAFVGVHEARAYDLIFVTYWADGNELRHHVWTAPKDDPGQWTDATHTPLVGCVWDLAVMAHEAEAWRRHVIANQDGPDIEAYLRDVIDAVV